MTTGESTPTRQQLIEQIEQMRPWHHDIRITDDLCTGEVFSPERAPRAKENDGVSLISPRERFLESLDGLFPDTMQGKRFLDCACNAGGYCFWAREKHAQVAIGFDVREHWIQQAEFVRKDRTVAPVDRIEFHEMDLYDVPKHDFGTFDMTYFSGIFYHLPDPITGLKIAADMTDDIIVVSTAIKTDEKNPTGLTMARESRTKVMSGVHEMSWFPNGPDCLHHLLRWLGFKEMKITLDINKRELLRRRIEIVAAREHGRLAGIDGKYFVSTVK